MNPISYLEPFAPVYSKDVVHTYGEDKFIQHWRNLLLLVIKSSPVRQNLKIVLENPLDYE